MRVIGRRAEAEELRRCERSGKSELVVVFGRRRVGKTFLVEQTFADQFAFRATGVEDGTTRQQLQSFHQRLRERGDTLRAAPKNWFEAFSRLEAVLSSEDATRSPHGKRVVFLDEFPWFATPRSDFLMAFGEFWNRCGTSSGDYLFIICGSATSWIIQNVLDDTGSLYDRVTCQIHLDPFTLADTERFMLDRDFGWSRKQIAECQMVFGGLPYFLDLLDPSTSLSQNIDRLCLAPYAMLRGESKKLLEATLKKSPACGKILDLLAPHKYGLPKEECFEGLGLPKGTFSRAVDELVKCGYIREYKLWHRYRNPLHLQLIDPFLLFHYRFIEGEQGLANWQDFRAEEGTYTNWRGNAFEVLCLQHVEQIKHALGISGVKTRTFPWLSERKAGGAQIDLVIERADGITNLCEMKFTDRPFAISADYEEELLNKVDVFREESATDQALKLVMVSASGIAGTAHTEHIAQRITLDDLFA